MVWEPAGPHTCMNSSDAQLQPHQYMECLTDYVSRTEVQLLLSQSLPSPHEGPSTRTKSDTNMHCKEVIAGCKHAAKIRMPAWDPHMWLLDCLGQGMLFCSSQ